MFDVLYIFIKGIFFFFLNSMSVRIEGRTILRRLNIFRLVLLVSTIYTLELNNLESGQ